MERTITAKVKGFRTQDGAGVSLVRVLGNKTVKEFDPILMLDSFDSTNPAEYTAGFPMHPHRGIETVSYVYRGKMLHKDSLGNSDMIGDGEVQWMNAGSGILHEEQIPKADRMLGVQLWLNLPAKEKMSPPLYHSIKNEDITEIEFEGGKLRLLAGRYQGVEGYMGKHLPLDYYDVHLNPGAVLRIETPADESVMAFTSLGGAYIGGEYVEEKTAVKLSEGETLELKGGSSTSQILVMKSAPLNEPIAWAGPIVMNTRQELDNAFKELQNGTFIKQEMDYK